MQARFEADYKEALVTVKEEMRESEGEEIEDEMQGEIRKWFFAERDDQGKFPDYPSDDEGGSVAIFHPERLVSANGMSRRRSWLRCIWVINPALAGLRSRGLPCATA